MSAVEILIAEDDVTLRKQIESFLRVKGYSCHSCQDAKQAQISYTSQGADIVILDVKLGETLGTDVLRHIVSSSKVHPPVILMTGHGDKALAIEALRLGAFDFLEKPFETETLLSSVEKALKEKENDIAIYRSQSILSKDGGLSTREQEVASLVSQGFSNDIVAQRLQISIETVKTHLKNIYRKLGVDNRTSLSSRLNHREEGEE